MSWVQFIKEDGSRIYEWTGARYSKILQWDLKIKCYDMRKSEDDPEYKVRVPRKIKKRFKKFKMGNGSRIR